MKLPWQLASVSSKHILSSSSSHNIRKSSDHICQGVSSKHELSSSSSNNRSENHRITIARVFPRNTNWAPRALYCSNQCSECAICRSAKSVERNENNWTIKGFCSCLLGTICQSSFRIQPTVPISQLSKGNWIHIFSCNWWPDTDLHIYLFSNFLDGATDSRSIWYVIIIIIIIIYRAAAGQTCKSLLLTRCSAFCPKDSGRNRATEGQCDRGLLIATLGMKMGRPLSRLADNFSAGLTQIAA